MKRPTFVPMGCLGRNIALSLALACFLGAEFAMADPDGNPAKASDVDSAPAPAVSKKSPTPGVEEITVVARKRVESLQAVPVSVSAFSGVKLEQAGVEEFYDVQYVTPNLQLSGLATGGSTASVTLRGQGQADTLLTTDSSVGVYLDGVNLPRQLGLRSNQFDVERVEVLRGPQGTLYGRNTTGGAINVIAKKASLTEGLSGFADVKAGNLGLLEVGGALNFPVINDMLAVRLAGNRQVRDRLGESRVTGRDLGDNNEYFLRGSLLFAPSESVELQIVADMQKADENGFLQRTTGVSPAFVTDPMTGRPAPGPGLAESVQVALETGALRPADLAGPSGQLALFAGANAGNATLRNAITADNFQRAVEDQRTTNDFSAFGLGTTLTVDMDFFTVTSVTGYRRFDRRSVLDIDGTPFDILHGDFKTDLDFFSEELRLDGGSDDKRFNWLVGAFYSREDGNETQGGAATAVLPLAVQVLNPADAALGNTIFDGDVVNRSAATFAQLGFKLTERLNLTVGGRYTVEEKDLISFNRRGNGSCITPGQVAGQCRMRFSDRFRGEGWDLTLDYTLGDDTLTYAKVSKGFRGGGQNLRGGSVSGSFDSFEPEEAINYEAGLKASFFDRRAVLNLAAFYTDYQDVQRLVTIPTTGQTISTVLRNAADAHIAGYEIETTFLPLEGLTLNASFGFANAEYEKFDDVSVVRNALTGQTTSTPIDRQDEMFALNGADTRYQTTFGARYEFDWGQGRLGLSANWFLRPEAEFGFSQTIDRSLTNDNSLLDIDEYNLVNVRLDYSFGDYEIAAFANNLFNEEYAIGRAGISSIGIATQVLGDPRVVGVQLRRSF